MRYIQLFFLLFFTVTLYAYPSIPQKVKEKKVYPMGKKIYEKVCKNIDPLLYESYEVMQKAIHEESLCKPLSKKHMEALSLYLWEVKTKISTQKKYPKLEVTKDEKCPVCGMYLYKYPTWISRIVYKDKAFSFDGIKDMMKYYFEHQDGIKDILVQDYYTQETLDAKKAFFVLGSDVYGPMGNEIIALKDAQSAKHFLLDHRGVEILLFDALTIEKVYKLDE